MAVKAADQISVVDLTDGYSVMLTSDSASFAANTSGKALAATTFVTQVIAMRGTETIQPSVTKDDITCPSNITASVSTASPYSAMNPGISITVTAAFTGNTAEVVIPVHLENDIVIEKKFSIAASKTGATGANITVKSTAYAYQLSTSGTTIPTGTWQTSPQAPTTTQFAWTRTTTTFSDNSTAVTYTVGGKVGATGSQGNPGTSPTVSSSKTQYQKSTSGTAVPTGTWSDSAIAPDVNNYVWTKTTITYSDGATAVSYAVAGKQGTQGNAGADAITMSITSSAGTIFKNTSIATTLTATAQLEA